MKAVLLLIVAFAVAHIEAGETCNRKLDFALIVDGSTSICPTSDPCPLWYSILQLCKDIVDSLDIGFNKTRVAMVGLYDNAEVFWNLTKYTDKESLRSAIDKVPYRGGELSTPISLVSIAEIITGVFNPLIGDRLCVQNIKIIISDGAPKFPDLVWFAESLAVQVVRDVIVFAVCIKPRCTDQVAKAVASYSEKANETYFFVDDNFTIDKVKDPLVKSMCAYETIWNAILSKLSRRILAEKSSIDSINYYKLETWQSC
jgi:hypothetical protein